ncbi:MAG: RNA 2',3'-cyclic phosphodiesterase [bacterium]
MRLFLGIPCPRSVASELAEAFQELKEIEGLKPVAVENYHITVKFLGDAGADFCRRLDSGFQRMLPAVGPLQLKLKHVGVFPNISNPRVIWGGIRPRKELIELNEAVEKITAELGIKEEKRDYHPHVTIGRIKKPPADRHLLVQWLKKYGNEEFGQFQAPHLVLYESELTAEGPVYKEVMKWPI